MGMPRSHNRMPRIGVPFVPLQSVPNAKRPLALRSRTARNPFVKLRRRAALRTALPLLLCLTLSCATDPGADYLSGVGDPVRGAALYAPRNLGDTSRWAGRLAEAALAAEQLEFLASELAANPRYAPEVDPAVTQRLDLARAEMRGFLGIAPEAAPTLVMAGLRAAANALRAGSRAQAEAALSDPAFAAGPLVTLARLGAMPRLPRTAEAAGGVAAEFDRLDRRR